VLQALLTTQSSIVGPRHLRRSIQQKGRKFGAFSGRGMVRNAEDVADGWIDALVEGDAARSAPSGHRILGCCR
jgi:hypothetical protein